MAVDAVHAEDRSRVAADRHEGAVPERDLAAVARENREAEQRDEVHADDRELARAKVTDEPGQRGDDRNEHEEADELERELELHTRRTATRPKRPPGLTSKSTAG